MAGPYRPVGNTANQEALESTASVGAHDDKVDTGLRYEISDVFRSRTLPHRSFHMYAISFQPGRHGLQILFRPGLPASGYLSGQIQRVLSNQRTILSLTTGSLMLMR